MGALAVDSSAAIAFFTAGDAHHDRAVAELTDASDGGGPLSMVASAYSEIAVHAVRKGRRDVVERFVDRLRIEIVPVDRRLALAAAELRAAHRWLRLPDALVVAAAQARQAELLTFDARLARLAGEGAQS
ncbi:MAG: PIN domain-containing protein [Solirubrobacterales bacterium]